MVRQGSVDMPYQGERQGSDGEFDAKSAEPGWPNKTTKWRIIMVCQALCHRPLCPTPTTLIIFF